MTEKGTYEIPQGYDFYLWFNMDQMKDTYFFSRYIDSLTKHFPRADYLVRIETIRSQS